MFPRWLGWIFLIFLGYILYLGNFSSRPEVASAVPKEKPKIAEAIVPVPTKEAYPAITEFTDTERWQRAIKPDHIGPARWREVKEGDGEGALCGGQLTVKIAGIPNIKEETKQVTLGSASYKVLNTALIGLKPGGVREISAPPDQVYKQPKKQPKRMVDFTVERLDGVAPAAK